jgi:hypothetical protein
MYTARDGDARARLIIAVHGRGTFALRQDGRKWLSTVGFVRASDQNLAGRDNTLEL